MNIVIVLFVFIKPYLTKDCSIDLVSPSSTKHLRTYLSLPLSFSLFISLSLSSSIALFVYLSLPLSFSLSISLSLSSSILPVYLSFSLILYPSLVLSLSLSLSLSISLFLSSSILLSFSLSIALSLSSSILLYLALSISLSLCLSLFIYPSVCLSLSPLSLSFFFLSLSPITSAKRRVLRDTVSVPSGKDTGFLTRNKCPTLEQGTISSRPPHIQIWEHCINIITRHSITWHSITWQISEIAAEKLRSGH